MSRVWYVSESRGKNFRDRVLIAWDTIGYPNYTDMNPKIRCVNSKAKLIYMIS